MELITSPFKAHTVDQFYESLTEQANTVYYVGVAKSIDTSNSSAATEDSVISAHYDIYDQLVFGRRINSNDARLMVRRVDWVSGTVYAQYDPNDAELGDKNFYVVTSQSEVSDTYHVFKCLNNNGGIPSTEKPTFADITPDDEFYRTADGYEWKYMFTIDALSWEKFKTSTFIPIIPNATVKLNAVDGAIESYRISVPGSNYNSYAEGNFSEAAVDGNDLVYNIISDSVILSANSNFYRNNSIYIDSGRGAGQLRTIIRYNVVGSVKQVVLDEAFDPLPDLSSTFKIRPRVLVVGDGTGATALANVNTATKGIDSIDVITRGSGYTYANMQIFANTGLVSVNSTPVDANGAIVNAVISPPGGHGYDPVNELFAKNIGISVEFNGTENGNIPAVNEFNKIVLMKDPLWRKVDITLVDESGSSFLATNFINGEEVIQYNPTNELITVYRYAWTVQSNTHPLYQANVIYSNTEIDQTFGSNNTPITFTYNDRYESVRVYLNDVELANSADVANSSFDQYYELSNNDIIFYNTILDVNDTIDVDILTSATSSFTGDQDAAALGTVTGRNSTTLTLSNVKGTFAADTVIKGLSSNTVAYVGSASTNFQIFDQRTLLELENITTVTDEYELNQRVAQSKTDVATRLFTYENAEGYIYNINKDAGNTTIESIHLINVKGIFTANSDPNNTDRVIATNNDIFAGVSNTTLGDLVDNSGEILFVNDINAIERSSDRKETIKLIIGF